MHLGLKKLSSWYILPVLSFVLSFLVVAFHLYFLLLIFIWLGLKLFSLKNNVLKSGAVLGVFLGIFLGLFFLQQEKRRENLLPIENASVYLTTFPGDYKLKEGYLSGVGTVYWKNKKQKVKFSYQGKNIPVNENHILFLEGEGAFSVPEGEENDAGFSEKHYLKEQKIYRKIKLSRLTFKEKSVFTLGKVRLFLASFFQKHLPENLASFYQGTFLGQKDDYFYEQKYLYSNSGLWTLFSFSGLQFFFLLEGVNYLWLRLGGTQERSRFFSLIVGLLLLLILGFKSNLFRGLLFSSLNILPKKYFSKLDRFSLTLFFTQLFFPYQLLGFGGQMSFLVSFFWVCPISEKRRLNKFLLPILVMPLFWWHFFQWSLFTGLSFLFLRKIMTKILSASVFLLPFLVLFSPVKKVISYFYDLFLTVVNQSHHFLWITGRPAKIFILGYFLCVFLLIYFYETRNKKSYLVFLLVPILFTGFSKRFSPVLEVTFVNVRQGDSILLKSPFQKEVYLIDTGGKLPFSSGPSISEQTLIPYLKSRGISKIHKFFATHGDYDHIGDLLLVQREIPIEKIYYQNGALENELLKTTLEKFSNEKMILKKNEKFPFAKGKLEFLGPEKGQGENDDSLILNLQVHQLSFLFTGDGEKVSEQFFLKNYPKVQVDVLKVAHHGSNTSSSLEFLQQIKPKIAVISCGKNNSFNHPTPEVLDNLQKVNAKTLRTDERGTIRFVYYPFKKWQLETLVSPLKK